MAEGRGGYRKPPPRGPASGPGKFSQRNDRAVQPIREPDIDNPDLEYGDRQMLTAAQRTARLPGGGKARQTRPTAGGEPARSGPGHGLPPWLFNSPSAFPEEPAQAGLDMGPGPGSDILASQQPPPDIREQTLMYLANGSYGGLPNPDAQQALSQLRNERAAASMPPLAITPALMPTDAPSAQAQVPAEAPLENEEQNEPSPEEVLG